MEVVSVNPDSVRRCMRERFDTKEAATVAVVGEESITKVYDVPTKYERFSLIVLEIRETRSERGLKPFIKDSGELRDIKTEEIQHIDRQLRESDMNINGLDKELYESLKELRVRDHS